MTDAISRSAVLEVIDARSYDTEYPSERDELVNEIYKLPDLDVAPVVYCKDCIYARPLNLRELMVFDSDCFACTARYGAGVTYPEYDMTEKIVCPKCFCSCGHRRTNGR